MARGVDDVPPEPLPTLAHPTFLRIKRSAAPLRLRRAWRSALVATVIPRARLGATRLAACPYQQTIAQPRPLTNAPAVSATIIEQLDASAPWVRIPPRWLFAP
jgi:hypothetical protein